MDDDFIIDDEEIDYNILCNDTLQNFPFIEDDVDSLTDYELFSRGFGYLDDIKANKEDIPDLSDYVTKDTEDLVNYTKTEDLSRVALTGEYNDLNHKPLIPNKTSNLINDSGFIDKDVNDLTYYTKSNDLSEVATSGDYDDLTNKPTIPDVSNFITKDVNDLTYYTTTTDINTSLGNKANKTDVDNLMNYGSESVVGTWNNKPVYRRLISQSTQSGANYQLLVSGNINELIMSSGFIKYDGSNSRPINMVGINTSTSFFRIDLANDTHSIYANYSEDLRSKNYNIILEYTKITD